MALPKPPTAIVAANDEMAAGCIRALRQQGVRVPEDVSVTGFNDVSTAQYCEPPLTTIRVPLLDLGMRAMQMVLRARNGERVELEQVGVELIVRESTGPAKPAPASDVRIVEPRPQSEGV
jgi:DNA-binding LacI/PurR family transcriptional regulator